MFFQLPVLTSNNVVWVSLFAIFLMKHSTFSKHPPWATRLFSMRSLISFIEPQNFLLMFFIYKLKGLYLIVTACDDLLMLSLYLFNSCIKSTWYNVFQDVLRKCFTLVFLRDMTLHSFVNSPTYG